jgi:hypothetical protein
MKTKQRKWPVTPAGAVNKLLDEDPGALPGDVTEVLKQFPDLSRVVYAEWIREPARRRAIMAKTAARKLRKMGSSFGQKGDAFRRIMTVLPIGVPIPGWPKKLTGPTRQAELHSTKGWRSYRVSA